MRRAVRSVAAGPSAPAPAIAGRLIERIRILAQAFAPEGPGLWTLVATGPANQLITSSPSCPRPPVKSHLVHIFAKLEVHSRTAAAAVAVQRVLIRRSDRPR